MGQVGNIIIFEVMLQKKVVEARRDTKWMRRYELLQNNETLYKTENLNFK